MCGITGLIEYPSPHRDFSASVLFNALFCETESRGKDASGIVLLKDNSLEYLKKNVSPKKLCKSDEYRILLKAFSNRGVSSFGAKVMCGHARMATNGSENDSDNNQPVIRDGTFVIHNGIIVNCVALWASEKIERRYEVDTEVIVALYNRLINEKLPEIKALQYVFKRIEGAASIAIGSTTSNWLLLATNTGSLYMCTDIESGFTAFASERNMLVRACAKAGNSRDIIISQIPAGHGVAVDLTQKVVIPFNLELVSNSVSVCGCQFSGENVGATGSIPSATYNTKKVINRNLKNIFEDNTLSIAELKRCTRCLLPSTFPGIHFDNNGICSVCSKWKPIVPLGIEALEAVLENKNNVSEISGDVIIPLSGGRDSCFAFHYLKKVMGCRPVTYTYDWGMVTDLARRNISRITSALGVEHILISADIRRKRENIRKNVLAWLRSPHLGTVPLFMAGDKQFFYHSNILKKQLGINTVIYAMNPLERTDFKVALSGVIEKRKEHRNYHLSRLNRLRLLSFYIKAFLGNTAFLNSSLLDTLGAFLSYYYISHDYHILYEYLPWVEDTVVRTIIDQYGWEGLPDTSATWRIGDGTSAFYNYIYLTVAGFTENDTFRSNQIRQGLIGRDEALKRISEENRPSEKFILWYLDTLNLDPSLVLGTINNIPKLYTAER